MHSQASTLPRRKAALLRDHKVPFTFDDRCPTARPDRDRTGARAASMVEALITTPCCPRVEARLPLPSSQLGAIINALALFGQGPENCRVFVVIEAAGPHEEDQGGSTYGIHSGPSSIANHEAVGGMTAPAQRRSPSHDGMLRRPFL